MGYILAAIQHINEYSWKWVEPNEFLNRELRVKNFSSGSVMTYFIHF